MYKIILLFVFTILLQGCGGVEFVYNKNTTNPIYNNVDYNFSGVEIPSIYQYATRYFGSSENPRYNLLIKISEQKTKRSVQSNQAVSKLDYDLSFNYNLSYRNKNCNAYKQEIVSRFSYTPKAEGYNFGSDQSLEKLYELAAKESVEKFIDLLSQANIKTCDEN